MSNTKKLKQYEIWYCSTYGNAIASIKAHSFIDCFRRLNKRQKNGLISIEDILTNEQMSKQDIEETIFLSSI